MVFQYANALAGKEFASAARVMGRHGLLFANNTGFRGMCIYVWVWVGREFCCNWETELSLV